VTRRLRHIIESGAFLIGAALVLPFVIGGTILGGRLAPGLHLTLAPERSTVLDIEPADRTWQRTLRPTGEADGLHLALTARNASAAPLRVAVRTAATSRAVDAVVEVRVRTRGRTVFDGTLGQFRKGAPLGVVASHATVALRLDAWVPRGSRGYVAQVARISLTFDGLPLGA
jgi:hypothetical protein